MFLGMPLSDDHILLDVCVYSMRADGSPNYYAEPIFRENYGLEGMEDRNDVLAEVDVTDYAGQTVYMEVTDWGYNSSAYLIQIPEAVTPDAMSLSSETLFLFIGNSQRLFGYNSVDEEVLDLIHSGNTDFFSVAKELCIPAPFFAFKMYSLIRRGEHLQLPVDIDNRFLRAKH